MRVAIVAESFLPNVNGVTNSVLRVLEHLHETGQEAIVIAPGAREGQEEIPDYLGFPIYRVPTVRVPLVDSLPVGVPTTAVDEALLPASIEEAARLVAELPVRPRSLVVGTAWLGCSS